ncbi:MAG: efflux transporter outer membrane subunit [Sterolibacterium sp.]|nr:efflux transporter outer membrane subunit [Sterolibacterium sp.]
MLGGCAGSEGLLTQGVIASPASLSANKSLANSGTSYASNWPAEDWWHSLGDVQLDALINEAMQASPDLAAAAARVRQASALSMNADALRSPSISAMAMVQGIRIPSSAMPSSSSDLNFTPKVLGLNGSYNVDLWGGERATWEAALGRQRASEVDAQAARLTLSVDIARAYARLGNAYQVHDIARKNAERVQHLLELVTQRVTAGIDSTAQQHQAEAQAAATRQRFAQAAQAIESEQIALAILIGKGPDRATEITRPSVLQPVQLAVPGNLPADLLGRRPDIVAARLRAEAAQRDIDASKAGFYPSFNLSAAIGLVSLHTNDLMSLQSRYYSVTPAISLPIFDAGRLRANLAGRNAEYDIAVAQYNKTLVGAFNQVALQIQATQALIAQESAQSQSVNAAREAWILAMQRYRHGIGSYIEALIDEQSVLAAEMMLSEIRGQQIDTAIQLVHALGGGYATEAPNAPPSTTQTSKVSS